MGTAPAIPAHVTFPCAELTEQLGLLPHLREGHRGNLANLRWQKYARRYSAVRKDARHEPPGAAPHIIALFLIGDEKGHAAVMPHDLHAPLIGLARADPFFTGIAGYEVGGLIEKAYAGHTTPRGLRSSPLYGTMPARDFYAALFADTEASDTTLLNIFDSSDNGGAVALHFRYGWTLADGTPVAFEVVDVIELTRARDAFAKLTIIYDTAPLRSDWATVHNG